MWKNNLCEVRFVLFVLIAPFFIVQIWDSGWFDFVRMVQRKQLYSIGYSIVCRMTNNMWTAEKRCK